MTLTTHAVVGAAAASFFPGHPYAAFAAGFVSHLAIDCIPHWEEGPNMLRSVYVRPDGSRDMRLNKNFLYDLAYLGAESLMGLLLAILFFNAWAHVPLAIVLVGAAAGVLPDAMHFVYFKTRSLMLRDFERLHAWIQREQPSPWWLAVEAILIAGSILVVHAI